MLIRPWFGCQGKKTKALNRRPRTYTVMYQALPWLQRSFICAAFEPLLCKWSKAYGCFQDELLAYLFFLGRK